MIDLSKAMQAETESTHGKQINAVCQHEYLFLHRKQQQI